MREALRQVKPTEFEDLIALVALYRPGPMQLHPVLRQAQGRAGAGQLSRPAPQPILKDTYGTCLTGDTLITDAHQRPGSLRLDQVRGRRPFASCRASTRILRTVHHARTLEVGRQRRAARCIELKLRNGADGSSATGDHRVPDRTTAAERVDALAAGEYLGDADES